MNTTIFDIAKYILHKLNRMSTMKLQKLCYYAQAWSLVWDDVPLFDEEFYAWKNGPVCRELFNATRGMFSVCEDEENGDISKLTEQQKETINSVLEVYGPKDAQWLSRLTHLEDPWKNAMQPNLLDSGEQDRIITKESMAMYYGSL